MVFLIEPNPCTFQKTLRWMGELYCESSWCYMFPFTLKIVASAWTFPVSGTVGFGCQKVISWGFNQNLNSRRSESTKPFGASILIRFHFWDLLTFIAEVKLYPRHGIYRFESSDSVGNKYILIGFVLQSFAICELAEEKRYPPHVICQSGTTESTRLYIYKYKYIYIVVVMYTTLDRYRANNLMRKSMIKHDGLTWGLRKGVFLGFQACIFQVTFLVTFRSPIPFITKLSKSE